MKRLLFLALPLLSLSVYAADVNIQVNRQDAPGNYVLKNIRDRGNGTYADTVNSESNFSFSNINATSTVKTSAGLLHSVVIFSSYTAVSFYVYDSSFTAGTAVVIASVTAPTPGGTYLFDAQTANGIQVNMPTGSPNITVNYR